MPPRRLRPLFALAVLALVAPAAPAQAWHSAQLIVLDASSLKDAFENLAPAFLGAHPGARVVLNAAGSQELREQIEQGAAADVFASADQRQMDALVAAHLVDAPVVFTCNRLVVVTPLGSNAIQSLADLPRAQRLVLGAPQVPVGAYTQTLLNRAAGLYGADFPVRVQARVVSREPNVRQVLAKVVLGEADAAVVYASDAAAMRGKVRVVDVPAAVSPLAEYSIAVVRAGREPALARAFVQLVRGPAGLAALKDAGFAACPGR